ncbi:hypothetical protein HHK36_020572 [Tetracentron sinense]|uniref:NADP-dependent oxidoreductase domain-containing protein n=1 Tax=Tetracentron sinense TaxID=13715 RepID=A0A834YRY2_TETSI|nr:hypothetical protein HHK36_020572 [Tetracentron sinense]
MGVAVIVAIPTEVEASPPINGPNSTKAVAISKAFLALLLLNLTNSKPSTLNSSLTLVPGFLSPASVSTSSSAPTPAHAAATDIISTSPPTAVSSTVPPAPDLGSSAAASITVSPPAAVSSIVPPAPDLGSSTAASITVSPPLSPAAPTTMPPALSIAPTSSTLPTVPIPAGSSAPINIATSGIDLVVPLPPLVSKLGFGCAGLSGIYNSSISHEAGCSIIKDAFNKGITFFDTADVYGANYDNEIMVGKALKHLPRDKVQLATKFGISASKGGGIEIKGTPEYVRKCCEASLKHLDVNYIDLYFQHRVDTSVPIEDTVGELKKLVEEGKIKYIGLSEAGPDTIRRAHAVHPITALQMEYSLWTREIEEETIPLCRELGIGIVAFSPLGRGFFGGKAIVESLPTDSILTMHPRFTGDNLEKNKLLYARIADLAEKHGCTPPQLALAWVLHQGKDLVPIPGTTKIKNLDNNIGSLAMKLTLEDLKEISDAVPINEVSKLGFGCHGLSGKYNDPLSDEDGVSVMKDAFSKGITFFDTADIYGANANEILVGKVNGFSVYKLRHLSTVLKSIQTFQALKQLPRDKIQLATKFGLFKVAITEKQISGEPEYVRRCCEASLKCLDVDYIDLYYQHRVDKSVPIEDTMGELKKLVEEGKIKYVGLCEASPDTIRRAHAVHPITAVQLEWSLLTRDIEEEIIPLCRELGIGIVAYSPLARGFLGGKAVTESLPANSSLATYPRYSGENLEKNKVLYGRVANLAAKHGCTPPQLALSWVLHQGDDVVPIPGTTKIKNLDNNIGSLKVKLTEEELKEVSDAVPVDEVAGARIYEKINLHSWKFANTPLKARNVPT